MNEEALAHWGLLRPKKEKKKDGFSEAVGFCTEVEQKLSPGSWIIVSVLGFRLARGCSCCLRSSGMLRSVGWQLVPTQAIPKRR